MDSSNHMLYPKAGLRHLVSPTFTIHSSTLDIFISSTLMSPSNTILGSPLALFPSIIVDYLF